MPSWMTYLLRKIFSTTATVFRGNMIDEFRAVYSWLRKRLTDDYLPPSILDSSKPMSEHLRLLDNRKISNASQNDGIEDGISYARLLCDSTIQPTELIDDNIGWVCDVNFNTTVERLSLNCVEVTSPLDFLNNNSTLKSLNMPHLKRVKVGNRGNNGFVRNCTELTDIEMPEVEYIYIEARWQNEVCMSATGEEVMEFPKLKEAYSPSNLSFCKFSACRVFRLPELEKISYQNSSFLMNWENLEELYMPKYSSNQKNGAVWHSLVSDMPKLRKLIMNKPFDGLKQLGANDSILFANCPQAIHLEMGDNINVSILLNLWVPTMALRTDTTAEDYVDLREDMSLANNLEQFLYNFQNYIANKVADRTGTTSLTLTLSAEVYAALEAQDGQTILATLTNKNWTVASA
jgi:hypothetical protein